MGKGGPASPGWEQGHTSAELATAADLPAEIGRGSMAGFVLSAPYTRVGGRGSQSGKSRGRLGLKCRTVQAALTWESKLE